MGYIYKITNLINGNSYVGKTEQTIEKRWKYHLSDSKRRDFENRPLYRAINKYGKENFSLEEIEKVESLNLIEREIFWINYYNTYNEGYNATPGGDGRPYLPYEEIIDYYLKNNVTIVKTAEKFNCGVDSVSRILKNNSIEINNNSNEKMREETSVSVIQKDKEGNLLNIFNSMAEAAHWLVENNYAKKYNGGVRSHISDVCNGKRKSAYGFLWSKM